jgi:hypothetical protein
MHSMAPISACMSEANARAQPPACPKPTRNRRGPATRHIFGLALYRQKKVWTHTNLALTPNIKPPAPSMGCAPPGRSSQWSCCSGWNTIDPRCIDTKHSHRTRGRRRRPWAALLPGVRASGVAAPRKHIQIHKTSYVQIFPIKALANLTCVLPF